MRPKQQSVLIVGLGGGSMVHFLKHYDPDVKVDAVEIDPLVVELAEKYFGVRAGGNVRILTADAARYLQETSAQYDVIYMDAFLKPSPATDATGVPIELKTVQFYQEVRKRLRPDGLVAFNLNPHPEVGRDITVIGRVFPQVYVFRLADDKGLVVLASLNARRLSPAEMVRRGQELDRRFQTDFSFARIARRVTR